MNNDTSADASRGAIFRKLRSALPQASPLPDLADAGPWQSFDDPADHFASVLKSVGGRFVRVATVAEADAELRKLDVWQSAKVRFSAIAGLGDSTFEEAAVDDPHDLENVDFAILPGHFGVAENGAVWVTDEGVRHRVLYFIPQHIAIVIPGSKIVHNMHEAYGQIDVGRYAFAAFISGPSKTADIEQSLVIGAHGARSLTVFGIDEWQAGN
ncbi:MAG: LUD domain-containing protein [Planctomycetaceae bacterium]